MKNVPSNLSNLKSKEDNLDVDKLIPVPVELSKLSDVVKNDLFKTTEFDELVKKVNAIQTTGISNLFKKTDCNTNIHEIEKILLIMIIVISILLHKKSTFKISSFKISTRKRNKQR